VDDNSALYLILLFLLGSAFFSGSETALFSLNKIQQKKLENSETKGDKRILKLLRKPRFLLIMILLGNTLVNISISSYATLYSLFLKEHFGFTLSDSTLILAQIVITTIVILLFGEIVPKLISWASPYPIAKIVSIPLQIIGWILWPILKALESLSMLMSKKHPTSGQESITSEEFHTLIHSHNTMHDLDEHEKRILAGLFRLPKAELREIFIPRVDVLAIDETKSIEELKDLIVSSGYSRIPVFRSSIDDIVGIAYAKDILLHPEKQRISEIMRQAWFVTENMKVQTLLNQFKSKKIQIAIVVDEYGGTSGIITLEDIMEELVGEIHDEYDTDEAPIMQRQDEHVLIAGGMCPIRELNNELPLNIDPELYDNLADFLLEEFNHVPRVGEKLLYDAKYEFTILEGNKKRINKVRIEVLSEQTGEEE
jgi:putative hemolysin